MGTKATAKRAGQVRWEVIPGEGPVAQVAHPTTVRWEPEEAMTVLLEAAVRLPEQDRLLVTGGGFISLTHPPVPLRDSELRKAEFLSKLHAWTLSQLSHVIRMAEGARHDMVVGVDVDVNGPGPGQFALWIGRGTAALIPKRFPAGDEALYLAGVEAPDTSPYPRVVDTQIGRTLILVCHDAQAYNHRNRANVKRARRPTARTRAIQELDAARKTPGLAWALNLIHWISGKHNTRTFRISYDQLKSDFPGDVSVAAGIGYEDGLPVEQVPGILGELVRPKGRTLTKVILFR